MSGLVSPQRRETKLAPDHLPWTTRLSFGVGHVLNDVCCSMWFTYILIFFNKVILFSSDLSGAIILIGQVTDGFCTPFIGYFSDRLCHCWVGPVYLRRRSWYLAGTLCALLTFPFIFTPCIGCSHSPPWVQMVYYSAFVMVFQLGWATIQVSNLSLVPDLTPDDNERTCLLAIRYGFTVLSNMLVYVTMLVVLHTRNNDVNAPITQSDTLVFQRVAYFVVAVGTVTSAIFLLGVKERPQKSEIVQEERKKDGSSSFAMFKHMQVYQVAVVYTASQVFANVSQTIFPMYLHDDLHLGAAKIAILPFIMFTVSFIMSTIIKPLNNYCGRKVALCMGAIVGLSACVWVRFGSCQIFSRYFIYVITGMYGVAISTLMVTSLGITADFIGQDLDNGAFIYGIVSFCDKVTCGVLIMIIQAWSCGACKDHYRDSLFYVCGGAAALGVLAVLTMKPISVPTENTGRDFASEDSD